MLKLVTCEETETMEAWVSAVEAERHSLADAEVNDPNRACHERMQLEANRISGALARWEWVDGFGLVWRTLH